MRTVQQIESEVRFLGATLLAEDECSDANVEAVRAWAASKGVLVERVFTTDRRKRILVRVPDYKVRRGPA